MQNLLAAALFIFSVSIQAQVGTSPRTLTKRIEPQLQPRPVSARPAQAGARAVPVVAAPNAPLTGKDLEKQQMQLSAEEKKKLQWQMDRAEKGSDPAQFALGMRHLEGKGVSQDLKKARKWLEASAKQGNAEAKKALAEHPELPPLDPPKPAAPAAKP